MIAIWVGVVQIANQKQGERDVCGLSELWMMDV